VRGVALFTAIALTVAASGCGTTAYVPKVVARGELSLRYDNGFQIWQGGRRVSEGLTWRGLDQIVRCVPAARDQAVQAQSDGAAAIAFAVLGGALGVVGAAGLMGALDEERRWIWFGTGLGAVGLGAIFAGTSRLFKNRANGRAVDAHNLYNDAVGSLGASCDDLRYPAPAPITP
jgi:hypothetical protein